MADLFKLLKEVRNDLPGCKLASIVDLESGMELAAVSEFQGHRTEGTDAFLSDLYRVMHSAMPSFNLEGDVQAVVLDADKTTFVSEPIAETNYFWHVATDHETTLGFVQAIMRKYRERIEEGVRELTAH
jgi:predicted regulator of Ras-like GTPase activity (Roadblock/LC7/MglB family)